MLVATTLTHHFQVTTQMVFAGTLLRLPAGEIEDVIRHELADNLALESEALSAPHHRELRNWSDRRRRGPTHQASGRT